MRTIAIAVASAFAIAPAFAQWDGPYYNRSYSYDQKSGYGAHASVIESTPVYTAASEECWNPRTRAYEDRRESRRLDLSRCRMTSDSMLQGYDVRYTYGGNEYVTRMAYDPGATVRLGSDVNWDGAPYG